jgi:hypothetical protein
MYDPVQLVLQNDMPMEFNEETTIYMTAYQRAVMNSLEQVRGICFDHFLSFQKKFTKDFSDNKNNTILPDLG